MGGSSMKLLRVAYAFVESGGTVPGPVVASLPNELKIYLNDHRESLVERAQTGKLAEAQFANAVAKSRFEKIATGSNADFLTEATTLAQRLHSRMDARSRRGFFVAATYVNDLKPQSMVLKLDANPKTLAAIGGTTANPILESVDNLLDVPGELQKGAVYPDPRPNSTVCVGDKNRETSLYYLDAIEVTQRELPGKGIAMLLKAVEELAPTHLEPVTKALEKFKSRISSTKVLQAVSPAIPADIQAAVIDRLAGLRRPVFDVNPIDHATRGSIDVDGIIISGPASRIRDDVQWIPDPNGSGFIIQVRVAYKPFKRYE